MSKIQVRDLSVSYGKKQVLKSVSFEVGNGETVGILGANGSGKSTLIKAMCNMLPHSGDCLIDDKDVRKMSAKELAGICSYVPQKSGLSLEMSALDVVLMGFNPKIAVFSQPDENMKKSATRMLETMGLADRVQENYLNLSEGQKQLCILGRALVTESQTVLMDEPESALDVNVRHRIMGIINEWAHERKRSVLAVLHDIDLALNFCDKILLIADGKCADIIDCKGDELGVMERKLKLVYGEVCLKEISDYHGKKHLVMLKEDEV